MSTEQETNKAVVAHFNKAFIEEGDMDVFHQTISPDFVNHSAPPGQDAGIDDAGHLITSLRSAFPDLTVTIHDQVAEGDRVVTRKSFRGTHRGSFQGIHATGRTVEYSVIDIIRLKGGRFVEHWAVADLAGLRAQLEGK